MDWAKAKSIIIAALLAANLFLILMFVVLKAEDTADEATIRQETLTLLAAKNITVEKEIPLKHNEMPVLNVRYDRLDPEVLENALHAQTAVPEEKRSNERMLQESEDFLKDCKVWTDGVILDRYEQEEDTITISYRNEYEEMLIEDSYMICTIKDGKIVSLERHWLSPIDFGRTEKATMSASAALVSFLSDPERPEEITVEEIEMVYWINSNTYEGDATISDTAFPAWKITYNDGLVKHVPAYIE